MREEKKPKKKSIGGTSCKLFRLTWREVDKNRRSISRQVKNISERARVVEETAVVVLLTRHWKELGN